MKVVKSFLLFFLVAFSVAGQTQVSLEDYKRAVSFLPANLINKKVLNANIIPIWAEDSTGVAFITDDKAGTHYQAIEKKQAKIAPLFNHEALSKLLSDSLKTEMKPAELKLSNLRWLNNDTLRFTVGTATVLFNRKTKFIYM